MSVKQLGTEGGLCSKCQYVNVAGSTRKSGNSKGRNGKILSAESAALSRKAEEKPPCGTFSTNFTDEVHLSYKFQNAKKKKKKS